MDAPGNIAVVPILVGPLQVLLAILPALLAALGAGVLALFKPRTFVLLARMLWRQKLSVAVIVAVVCGAVWLLRLLPTSGASAGAVQAGDDWAMFRGGQCRLGATASADRGGPAAGPSAGGTVWAFDGDKTFHSSPALVGNRVFAVSADRGVWSDSGVLYCLDADTGAVVWRSQTALKATFSSPAVAAGRVVVGEGLHDTHGARVSAFDAATGKLLWQHVTRSHVESSPCIDGDRVFVGCGDDGYLCLSLSGDGAGNSRVLWHTRPDQHPDAETSPLAFGGRVFVGLGDGGNAVCALDAATGRELWRTPTPHPVYAPPTLPASPTGAPAILVAMGNGDFVNSAATLQTREVARLEASGASAEQIQTARAALAPAGELWRLDAATGTVQWKFHADETILGAPVTDDNRVFAVSRDGVVHVLSAEGAELGRWSAGAPVVASPALAGDLLYVATQTGRLYALDVRGSQPVCVWDAAIGAGSDGSQGGQLSSPAVGRGHVYIGSPQSGVLCVGKPGALAASEPATMPARGKLLWSRPIEHHAELLGIVGDRVVVSDWATLCLSLASGEELWRRFLVGPGECVGAIVFVAHCSKGRRVEASDAVSGETLWQAAIDVSDAQWLRVTGMTVVVGCTDGRILAVDVLSGAKVEAPHDAQPPARRTWACSGGKMVVIEEGRFACYQVEGSQ